MVQNQATTPLPTKASAGRSHGMSSSRWPREHASSGVCNDDRLCRSASASFIVDPSGIGRRASNDAGEANGFLVVRADVLPHLVMPVGPFVPALRAPVVEMMSDAAIPKNLGHSVGRPAILPRTTAGHEPDIATRVLMEIPWVTLVGH